MIDKSILVFLFIGLYSITSAVPTKKFAFLVATTKSWIYYRHQATLLHAYQTLIANNFPRDQIITMFYDDIANHPKNPEPGIIRNHPNGTNVYENVKKDYTREKVNANNFIAVLTGNDSYAEGPVIRSGPRDSLFLYLIGMGSVEYLAFPSGDGIMARKLVQTLENTRNEGKYGQIYINIETPCSSTLFDGILSTSNKIFVSAATYQYEFPYAVYCQPERRICYGSLYGVAWTQYSERLRELKSGEKRSLYDQFSHTRAVIPHTHVGMFGDLSLGCLKLKDFIAYKHVGKQTNAPKLGQAGLYNMKHQDENLDKLTNYYGYDHTYATRLSYENDEMSANRDFVKETMKNIFGRLFSYGHENIIYDNSEKYHHSLLEDQSNIYEEAIREFHKRCFDINKNPFVLQEIPKLAHLCRKGVTISDQIKAMTETCSTKHRSTFNIH